MTLKWWGKKTNCQPRILCQQKYSKMRKNKYFADKKCTNFLSAYLLYKYNVRSSSSKNNIKSQFFSTASHRVCIIYFHLLVFMSCPIRAKSIVLFQCSNCSLKP